MIVQSEYVTTEVVNMNKELARYGTFARFPVDSPVMPTRLAQAGFYSTGSGDEVSCFCCGLRVSSWTEGDNVLEIHRRLAPGCEFVVGESVANFEKDRAVKLKSTFRHNSNLRPRYDKTVKEDTHGRSSPVPDSGDTAEYSGHKNNHRVSNVPNSDRVTFEKQSRSCSSLDQRPKMHSATLTSSINGQIELYPGINERRPNHPDYSLRSSRFASFTEWPEHHPIDPSTLAAAGFFYAGSPDCVRCFFCSCGLKNLEYGDKPWVEHAKWSPDCAYVKLCKGNEFARLCQRAINYDNLHDFDELQGPNEHVPDDWLIENLNSVAAKLVMSKGYTQQDVEYSVQAARQKYGIIEMKAQLIMDNMSMQGQIKRAPNEERDNLSNQSRVESTSHSLPSITQSASGNGNHVKIPPQSSRHHKHIKSEKQILLEENRRLKDLITCKICMDSDACVALLPCGHLISCIECSKHLRNCPVCRATVRGTVRVYQA